VFGFPSACRGLGFVRLQVVSQEGKRRWALLFETKNRRQGDQKCDENLQNKDVRQMGLLLGGVGHPEGLVDATRQ
jgi:hypothetical protein